MKKPVNCSAPIITAFGALAVAVCLTGAAQAVTDTVFKYSTPKTGYLAFAGNAFTPLDDMTGFYVNNRRELRVKADDFVCFATPVHLPQGADMTSLAVWYRNQTATLTVSVLKATNSGVFSEIAKRNLPQGAGALLATKSIAGAAAIIDNQRSHYWLEYCATDGSTDSQLNSVRITYTYMNAGD
jgi:hypothetical protein